MNGQYSSDSKTLFIITEPMLEVSKGKQMKPKIQRYDGHNDGEQVEIETNWREPDTPAKGSTVIDGGHLVKDTKGRTYYVEREIALLPPQLNASWTMEARRRLPSVGNDTTIQDVLED
eukprot:scaffold4994_cov62-Alexandrium_tamarense.AAC.1